MHATGSRECGWMGLRQNSWLKGEEVANIKLYKYKSPMEKEGY
jgi:hypothetical protein